MVCISRIALDFILGVSKDLYPREFAGLCRMEDSLITEILVLPSTVWGHGFAQFSTYHAPHDDTIVGSVHSHPSASFQPSDQDLLHFSKSGTIHMIVKYPYLSVSDIAAYDNQGNILELMVIEDD